MSLSRRNLFKGAASTAVVAAVIPVVKPEPRIVTDLNLDMQPSSYFFHDGPRKILLKPDGVDMKNYKKAVTALRPIVE